MIDKKWIGYQLGHSTLDIERGRLKFFAKAIGETNPVYSDEVAAKAAGYADIPAPPTFMFAAELDSGALFTMLNVMGVPVSKILHGEEGFEYLAPIIAGDTVTVTSQVTDIYDKRGGALEFIVIESTAVNQRGDTIANIRNVTVVRN